MNGEHRFYMIAWSLILILALLAYIVTFVVLWEYRGIILVVGCGVLVFLVLVKAHGAINEHGLEFFEELHHRPQHAF